MEGFNLLDNPGGMQALGFFQEDKTVSEEVKLQPTDKVPVELEPKIISVKQLLSENRLVVPYYQRPYKWSLKNVNQLIDDILLHKRQSAYRLGTLVIHKEQEADQPEVYNVVDGQQRTITLTLIAQAIYSYKGSELEKLSNKESTNKYKPSLENLKFKSSLSKNNIRGNYKEIVRRIREFDEEAIHFFYYKCQLVQVVLEDISEAFQFFDSQNSRGKDLAPHDLLKAFHLREMTSSTTESERIKSVTEWEAMDSSKLAVLFRNYLFRIRNWSKGYSARYFTKDEVDVFKGVSPVVKESFPFADLYRISHFYVEGYNNEFHRNIDRNSMSYPFQLDQVIINGKRFFEMINHYNELVNSIKSMAETKKFLSPSDKNAIEILETIQNYDGKDRVGDKYVRNLFNCCLVYYIDKFGTAEISRAVEKFYIWSYSLRLELYAIHLASIDNHALANPPIFKIIKEAIHPSTILNVPLSSVGKNNSTRTDAILNLFKKMNYYHGQ
ncbi:DUF262 domain-containing protein [Pontibacter chinhatensis]|uniref:Uncharacterized protein n=1 Tax=Pontibacter chinhatensis TaxID=1436961 RepID=A0A1I2QN91_9BACT|nr:DUF262 domain-containing protein [Pontibacter chinhatensis]SFG29854.1 Protein of unknown function DUF262 [Pontibacter chinhatensis]